MQYTFDHLNPIPVRTWDKLQVNDTSLSGEAGAYTPGGMTLSSNPMGWNISMDTQADQGAYTDTLSAVLPTDTSSSDPLEVTVRATESGTSLRGQISILASENSDGTVILSVNSNSAALTAIAPALYTLDLNVQLQKNSHLSLVLLQDLPMTDTFLFTGKITEEQGAHCETFLLTIGAERSVLSCELDLAGDEAQGNITAIYLGDGDRSSNMNVRIDYSGAATKGDIRVKNMLRDKSRKILRDTLDFRRGAHGAVGREEEDTMVLSPGVRNLSVPLLLCAEDDVSGEHAASTGRPDEAKIFYLMCRGLTRTQAEELLVEGAFNECIEAVPSEAIRDRVRIAIRDTVSGRALS